MPKAEVFSLKNEKVGEVELADEVFAAPLNRHLIWEAVNHYLAKGRAGTAKTKVRSEVAGSGRKLWKQKGTGRARVGEIRTPKWRGGGTVHGPQPRSYDYAFPKKKRRGALRSALSAKVTDGQIKIVDELALADHKTRNLIGVISTLGQEGKVLVVDLQGNQNLERASNNIPTVKHVTTLGLNIHDLLKYDQLVISKEAALHLQEVLKK
ncbi:50S ribosomal protein L4 [Acanthopleuribacter pedis]|uniref:Large ribosomal subunit protein uL4 n=1 Tax=Acanthopleuribacter pedis TaxID=442870 RepID=A0A8J7QH41_9BACT|nr:50S ribosomal protein L4 [Acanthopleuribacter pedis]MBO1322275.1 50S ribosomal protein L4 [Acanthopleuribacter pedis]